jgi:photosystem II stability/assembly factor-like uncharacterized protein
MRWRSKAFYRFGLTGTIQVLSVFAVLSTWPASPAQSQVTTSDLLSGLPYRHIGPVGNRVSAVTGVPGDPNTYYFGAASGGVFRSTDGGHNWKPVFDDQDAASIGAIAIAPSAHNVIWVGTGEAFIRSNVSIGNGVYRSTDGGDSWEHKGLSASGRIGRVIVHPTDPDIVYAAALGHLYGPQEERGIFRTTDGGDSWERVLFVDENTGGVDVVMDPNNPQILFAATWQMFIRTWGRWSGGPGSGIYMSRDAGDSWERLEGRGLPVGTMGKIGLAMTASDSDRIYALIETNSNREYEPLDEHEGVLWRSDDGGTSWNMVNADHTLAQRPLYYSRVVAAPDEPDEVHFLSTRYSRSLNGGEDFSVGNPGGDSHDMWIDPLIPDRMIVGHDGGLSISTDRGMSWWRPRLPIAQMYHVNTDTRIPYRVYGNRQDGRTQMGPSNSLQMGPRDSPSGRGISIGEWRSVGGCETGFSVPDPVEPNIVWAGCYDGVLSRYDHRLGLSRRVSVWPANAEGWAASELRYRFQWTFPIHISPHDHERIYVGSQHVHVTTNGGQSWEVLSPDLTTNDKTKQQKTGGLTTDDAGPTYAAVLFAIAESPQQEGVIWTGSNDGLVHVSLDGGQTWTNVTENIPDLPPWGTVSNIEPSRHDAGAAYLTVDLHQLGDTEPYVYKTTDYGDSWTSLSPTIPRSVFSYAHVIREDPVRPGLLYLGTENALYVSLDDGENWTLMRNNLPPAPVHDLTIQSHFNDLVVATYGRGFWIMDDITPLQELTEDVIASEVHLFTPRTAYRFLTRQRSQSQPEDPGAGTNPTYGASISFFLERVPEEGVQLEIHDEGGRFVQLLDTDLLRPGINRVHWDLEEEASNTPTLRTAPVEHSHVEFPEESGRSLGEGERVTPLAPPGNYTVTLRAAGFNLVQPLLLLKDPNSGGSELEIQEQVTMVREIRESVDSVVALIDEIEWIRAQTQLVRERNADHAAAEEIREAGGTLEAELIELEMRLFDVRLTGGTARQDTLRWARRLYARLTSLAGYITGTDDRPTDQAREVFEMLGSELGDYQRQMAAIREDLATFNRLLDDRGIEPIPVN